MVLESIITTEGAKNKPRIMFILGVVYAAIAIVLSYFIFPSNPSLSVIFLATIASLPILINVLTSEEEESFNYLKINKDTPLIGTHLDVFSAFTFIFLGFLVCFLVFYVAFPESINNLFFSEQIKTIQSIVGPTGFFGFGGGINAAAVSAEEGLKVIMLNNFKVLLFCLLFSFLYGAGAIFILAWNASVLATAMGNFIKTKIAAIAAVTGGVTAAAYFQAVPLSFLRYMIHGIPEVGAYFLGAIAGGIISAAVVKSDYRDPRFYKILMDSLDLIALAVLLLIVASLLEVSVTPLLVS
jgi:hypothetical protein